MLTKSSLTPDFEDDIATFGEEISIDRLTSTLTAGVADGSIAVSDVECTESDTDSACTPPHLILLCRLLLTRQIALDLPITSTPFVRKPKSVVKGCSKVGKVEAKVSVHDGIAMRFLIIKSSDSLFSVWERIAAAMKRPNTQVEMGYEAPWSTKIGLKKSLAYITNADELNDFWLSYTGYLKKSGKKQLDVDGSVMGIVFHNMRAAEGTQVSACLVLTSVHSPLAFAEPQVHWPNKRSHCKVE